MTDYVVVKPPKRQSDWKGCRVRTTREIVTGERKFPAGRLGTVGFSTGRRIWVAFDPCTECGEAGRFSFAPANYHGRLPVEFVAAAS